MKVFIVDALGAFVSIFLLLMLIAPNERFFGASNTTVIDLSIPILGLLIFSTSCFFLKPTNWKNFMKFLVLGNVAYCLFTTTIILLNFNRLSFWGVLYFLAEILVILFIIGIEIKTIKNCSSK